MQVNNWGGSMVISIINVVLFPFFCQKMEENIHFSSTYIRQTSHFIQICVLKVFTEGFVHKSLSVIRRTFSS